MTKRLVTVGFAVIVVVLLALVVVHKKQQLAHLPLPPNPPTPVRTAAVRDGQASNSVETVALVQSETAATVAAQVPGAILEMRWREGDRVAKGQVMALIDPRTLEDAVQTAQARLAAADEDYGKQKAIFARDKALLDGGAIAPQAFDISKAQLAGAAAARVGAEKALQSARVVRSYASTSAPYAGVVTARLAEPGDLAFPGKPLYTIQVPGPVKLLSKLAQDQLAQLRAGDRVTFGSGATAVVGTTSRIYPALDAAHLGSIETVLPRSPFDLPPGATVSARYAAAPAQGLVVPNEALLQGIAATLVVKVENDTARPVPVTIVRRGDEGAVVTAQAGELRAGDTVVVGLPSELMALTAGTRVAAQGGGAS
ncbi:MAG: efflux RND transporter periplasmic adaptor subunit [Acidobacteria bacterium]|nr:MAG: efflux RND transporter periplasmic adaptor subunit [Acidobacteriota bacterium]